MASLQTVSCLTIELNLNLTYLGLKLYINFIFVYLSSNIALKGLDFDPYI